MYNELTLYRHITDALAWLLGRTFTMFPYNHQDALSGNASHSRDGDDVGGASSEASDVAFADTDCIVTLFPCEVTYSVCVVTCCRCEVTPW